MKVLQLLPRLDAGGVETMVLALNRGLVNAGLQSVVMSDGGELADTVVADGGVHLRCDIASKNILTAWPRAKALARHINSLQPDLVHVHSRVPAWLLRFVRDGSFPPVVSTLHGFHSKPWYSNVLLEADRIICPCQALHDAAAAASPGKRQQLLRLVPNGVDMGKYDPQRFSQGQLDELRAELGIDPAAAVITLPGRFSGRKGQELLLQAFSVLARHADGGKMTLLYAGDEATNPGLVSRLREQCRRYELGGQVVLGTGKMPMVAALAVTDVAVSASLRPEGFGLTLVEANAMAKPVVAAAHGGALDIVAPGVTGELFTPGDPESLAASLRQALDRNWDHESIRSMTSSRFTTERMVAGTLEVYQELLS